MKKSSICIESLDMMSVNNYGNSETLLQNGLNFLNNKSLLFSRQLHFFLPIANSLKPKNCFVFSFISKYFN